MRSRHLIGWAGSVTAALFVASCSDEDPAGVGTPAPDSGTGGVISCVQPTDCPSPMICSSGICTTPSGGTDGGPTTAGPRLEVCTPDGCGDAAPRLNFGGSRIGVSTFRTLTLKSTGTEPVTVRHIEILTGQSDEFSVEPNGAIDMTLAVGEQMPVRVAHQARDGRPDAERLQIISTDARTRAVVELVTEYKGVSELMVTRDPASNSAEVMQLDFGEVRVGAVETRTIYVKNIDRVIDGSILTVSEVRTDPQSSTVFQVVPDSMLPHGLNQFQSACATDANCDTTRGDHCEMMLGVCAGSSGKLVDVLTLSVTFNAQAPGQYDEAIVIQNDEGGGQGDETTKRILLTARAVYAELDVSPNPIDIQAYIGFTARRTATLTNHGTSSLTIQSLALSSSGTLSLDLMGQTFPAVLMPGGTRTVDVVFSPVSSRTATAAMIIMSDDRMRPVRAIPIVGTATIAPTLVITPARADFGDVPLGANPSIEMLIRNTGGSELRIPSLVTTATTSQAFTIDPLSGSLPPIPAGGQSRFFVRYTPTGVFRPLRVEGGAVVVTSNDPRRPTTRVGVSARAIDPRVLVMPTSLNFNDQRYTRPAHPGQIWAGERVEADIQIFNIGVGPLAISQANITGDARGSFQIVNAPPLPWVVDETMSMTIRMAYQTMAVGTDGAQLVLTTNALSMNAGTVTLALAGSSEGCPARTGMSGTSNAAGVCTYQCQTNFYDLDGNPNDCEYACTFQSMSDPPDLAFVDANCDGIDGIPSEGVFVRAGAPPGGNGTMASPYDTVANGLTAARATGRRYVFLSAGDPHNGTVNLGDGIDLIGGYDPAQRWRRVSSPRSVIAGGTTAVRAIGLTRPTLIQNVRVESAANSAEGGSSIAIYISSSGSNLTLEAVEAVARSGGAGAAGASPGGAGAPGGPGSAGNPGCEDSGGLCSNCSQPTGGAPGNSACGRNGGRGGRPGNGCGCGTTGDVGAGGTPGGPPGCGCGCGTGTNGTNGAEGPAGNNGAAGSAAGAFGLSYTPERARTGARGTDGNGGGGGGGGSGGNDDCDSYGSSGGGGGGGGCGGVGAEGGGGGGGSFAIYIVASSPVIASASVITGNGGPGGLGGTGQAGGSPGSPGGPGQACGSNGEQDDGGQGAAGGWGGAGGRGGHGGGGGGGPSVGIVSAMGANPMLGIISYQIGSGGPGGPSPGNQGAPGLSADRWP